MTPAEWLIRGEVGISSKTMCSSFIGADQMKNIKKGMPLPIDTIVLDEDCQKAFESWMEKQSWPTQERHEGGYRDDIIHTFWRGWQACWAELKLIRSTPAEQPELVTRADRDNLIALVGANLNDQSVGSDDIADALIAAGWRKGAK